MRKREASEINASSMADIAFLLLIFFLVTTTMDIDKGILVTLPPLIKTQEPPPVHKRNVLEILINAKDQLLVENENMQIADLKSIIIKHLDNNGVDPNFSDSPQKAVVSLQNDTGTTYKSYIHIYNEIRAGYNHLRNQLAEQKFNKPLTLLNKEELKIVKDFYPLKLSEADPFELSVMSNE